MKAIIFGATGMVGQSVLRECLLDARVTGVLTVGRAPINQTHEKLTEVIHEDLNNLSTIETNLKNFDTCFFSIGISSAGRKEEEYAKITYDLTLSIARTLVKLNPHMTFFYVTARGTDSSEKGKSMWARVKGKTENALLKLPFKAAYMIRPSFIIPVHGVKSRTGWYNSLYKLLQPATPLLLKMESVLTSEELGKAMIEAAFNGYPKPIIESYELKKLAKGSNR